MLYRDLRRDEKQHRHCCVALLRSCRAVRRGNFFRHFNARCHRNGHAYLNHIVIRKSTCWTRRHGSNALSPSRGSSSTFSHFLTPFDRSTRQHSTATISASARSISIMLCNYNSGLIFALPIVGPVL